MKSNKLSPRPLLQSVRSSGTIDDIIKRRYFALKRVMVTGASSGIGRACAIWLLNQGARVALVGRNKAALDEIGEQFPHQAVSVKCDFVSDLDQYHLVVSVVETLGGLDILINAAGLIFENDLESTYPQDHDYLIDLNLRAVFHISSMCSTYLKRSKGCIVNFSGEWGNRPQQGMISYCMSKKGVEMLTKCLALELKPVRVNAVAPGVTRSQFFDYLHLPKSEQNWIYRRAASTTPLKRVANPDDVVKVVVFLCSKLAAQITGQIISVDGGSHLTSSLFTHWDSSSTMPSKIFPNNMERKIYTPLDPKLSVKQMLEKSRWFTDMAETHTSQRIGNVREEFDSNFIDEEEKE
jgi:NAD(P)-dependent dehydrogenase (short-subunit alcohol dehydrogenase family)